MIRYGTRSSIGKWVEGLIALANISSASSEGSHLVAVVAPPSPELASTLLGAACVVESNPVQHKPASYGQPVSYVVGRKIYDSVLQKSEKDHRIRLGGSQFNINRQPEMVSRPPSLEARSECEIPGHLFGEASDLEAIQKAKSYFRLCIRPVVILTTRPADLIEYFEAAQLTLEVWDAAEQSLRFATNPSIDHWFRSPILIVTPEQTRNRDWIREVEPAAVIAMGWKSWRKPARWNWPSVNHFLILDVRGEDIEFFREYYDGTEGFQQIRWDGSLGSGLQPLVFAERLVSHPTNSDWDEEIDLD